MNNKYQHRHDLTDEQWKILSPILPGQRAMGRGSERQSIVYKRCFVDIKDGSALEGFTKRIWEMG